MYSFSSSAVFIFVLYGITTSFTPYPDVEYVGLDPKSNQQKYMEKKQKDFQKTLKQNYYNSKEFEDHKEHVKAQRKLKYKELKEKYKK